MDSMTRLAELNVVSRLAEKDASLFASNDAAMDQILARMGWIGLAIQASEKLPYYDGIVSPIVAEGVTDVVLLGMGGSSLASLVFAEVFPPRGGHPSLHVLDTTSPVTVASLLKDLDPATTRFLLSSKSGTTIEPLSLYAVFREWADEALGRDTAGSHFIAITDPGTPLEELARSERMRCVVPAPPDVGGRFSALTEFGVLPAALLGVDLATLLLRATETDRACTMPGEANPAARLAGWACDAQAVGRDKLTLVASEPYASFPLWVEQLIAESTGKHGSGIVPIPQPMTLAPAALGDDRAVVVLRSPEDAALRAWADEVEALGHPVFEIELRDALDIGSEFVRWEYATAMIGALLGINPFDEPDVGAAKKATLDVLQGAEAIAANGSVNGVRVTYAGRLCAPPQTPTHLADAFAPLFTGPESGEYLALLAYVPYEEERLSALRDAVPLIASARRTATCLELGPRYLHSTGQLHKGGPDEGTYLIVTARDSEDVVVPGQAYSLAQLHRAQADGDLITLASRSRRVMHVDLPDSLPETVSALADALIAASHASQPA